MQLAQSRIPVVVNLIQQDANIAIVAHINELIIFQLDSSFVYDKFKDAVISIFNTDQSIHIIQMKFSNDDYFIFSETLVRKISERNNHSSPHLFAISRLEQSLRTIHLQYMTQLI